MMQVSLGLCLSNCKVRMSRGRIKNLIIVEGSMKSRETVGVDEERDKAFRTVVWAGIRASGQDVEIQMLNWCVGSRSEPTQAR